MTSVQIPKLHSPFTCTGIFGARFFLGRIVLHDYNATTNAVLVVVFTDKCFVNLHKLGI